MIIPAFSVKSPVSCLILALLFYHLMKIHNISLFPFNNLFIRFNVVFLFAGREKKNDMLTFINFALN